MKKGVDGSDREPTMHSLLRPSPRFIRPATRACGYSVRIVTSVESGRST